MKSIDFSKPGGFPLTQDQLGYMQTAYTEALTALAGVGGTGPIAISGAEVTRTTISLSDRHYEITDGWILYNGEMLRVTAGSMTINTALWGACINIARSSTPLTYNDGSTPNVVNDAVCTLGTMLPGSTNTTTYFGIDTIQKYGRETNSNVLTVNTLPADGGVSGNIYYRKNFLNNTLQLSASLGCANVQNFMSAGSPIQYIIGTLPEGYRCATLVHFVGVPLSVSRLKDDLDVSWLDTFLCTISSNGVIGVRFIRPQASVPSYGFTFNVILPLD